MGRVFACSDLHGMLPLYEQINNFLEPDDKVYFLGDAADRGPEGWTVIRMIASNPQWIYMQGNHEAMLADAIKEELIGDWRGDKTELLYYNGGYQTLEDWRMAGAEGEWSSFLRKLPVYQEYVNKDGVLVRLSHAGFTPYPDSEPDPRDLIWNRKHIHSGWQKDFNDNQIIIHGHTPIYHMREIVEPGALWYCDNHKVCIDNASFATGQTCLLDLDTFDEHIFEIPNFKRCI